MKAHSVEAETILRYWLSQSPEDDHVIHMEKAASERVGSVPHEIWDVPGPGVITPGWANSLSTLGEHAPVLLGFIVCTYIVLIAIAAVVGSLHPDEKRRADAQKVLGRLLGIGRRRTRR